MAEDRVVINRRKFLYKSATFFAGSLLGMNCFSRAFAANNRTNQPSISLIIDDIGFSWSRLREFLEIQIPMTYAILPRLEMSRDLAKEIHGHGHEIMLHQPMEPIDPHIDPGPGAVYVGDDTDKIVHTIGENISEIPFVTGINNHMGSRFTSRQKEMKEALEVIKKRGLFFVDSLTTNRSTAYKTARRLHMATACRNLFLDYCPKESVIRSQLCKLRAHAVRFGHAIGIGHPHPETARAIDSFQKGLKGSGIAMVHISRLIPS